MRREATLRRHPQTISDDDWELPAGPGADQAALRAVIAGPERDASAQLPLGQRQALVLAYYGGYSQAEMAVLLGIPLGTVKSRTFSAMTALRERLEPLATNRTGRVGRRPAAGQRPARGAR